MQLYGLNFYKLIYAISILGFQQFNLNLLTYILVFLFSLNSFFTNLKKQYFFFGFALLFFAFLFLLIKGFPLYFSLNLTRFYFGSILFGLLLYKKF